MRAHEFIPDYQPMSLDRPKSQPLNTDKPTSNWKSYHDEDRPRLTLRKLNKLRKENDAKKKEKQEHLDSLPDLYGREACLKDKDWIALQKNKAEAENTRAELDIERLKVLAGLGDSKS